MRILLWISITAVLAVGCSGPAEPQGDPNAQSTTTTTGSPTPPTNIGDGEPIVFTEWNEGVRKGTGTLTVGATETKIELATLKLNADKTFNLSLGNAESGITEVASLNGTWSKKDDRSVALEIKEAATEATGTVTFMDPMNPSEVAINGTKDGNTMALTFDVSE